MFGEPGNKLKRLFKSPYYLVHAFKMLDKANQDEWQIGYYDNKNDEMFAESELLLFSSSRAQLVREKIRPYLEKGIYVISDRFHDSSTAYQGYGRGVPLDIVNNVHNLAIGETVPELTFFIDIPVGIANERRKKKSKRKLDRMELADIEFYNRVRSGYLEIARNEERFKVIDGTQTIETIQNQIISELELINRR